MDFLKRAFIKKVVDDLIPLNGTEFEYFCKPIFDLIVNEVSIHKGSNLYAKPISRTVDFSTNNFETVGQCGTDSDYFDVFSKKYDELLKLKLENTKPIKDIYSTLKNSAQCSKIILFANQEAKAGRLDNINKVVRYLDIKQEIIVFDSESIANIIADNISNQKFILSLIDYLPTASTVYSAISMHNKLPPLPSDFVIRKEEASIIEMINENKVSVVHGVSGIGKSKIVLGITHQLISEFDSIIWVGLNENKEFNFSSAKVSDFDKNLNIANLCATYKTLIILDNFFGNVTDIEDEFKSFARDDSRVLITSLDRSTQGTSCIHLSEMSTAESREVINKRIDIDSRYVDRIIDQIGGHPLCLELVCQIIKDEKYNDSEMQQFLQEIQDIPNEIVRGKSQTISDLIIGKYADKFQKEFSLISLINSEQISNYIFNKLLGMKSIRNLEKASLIVRSGLYHSNIHSIVLLSINNLIGKNPTIEELKKDVCNLLLVENEYKKSGYYSFCVTHNKLLNDLYQDDLNDSYRKALLYAIIQTTDNLVFKENLISEVESFDLSKNTLEDLLLLIEKFELELISIDRKTDEIRYQLESTKAIEELERINLEIKEENSIKLLLEHHIAKIYYWKGDISTSKILFSELLSKFPDSEQCMLQLARIADNKKQYKEAEKYIDEVLGNIRSESAHSIILSFYDLISNSKYETSRKKYIDNRIEEFISNISVTLLSSFDHPYRVLSSLSGYLGYNLPDAFVSLCKNLPTPDNAGQNTKLMMSYADIQMALYRLYKYNDYDHKYKKLSETSYLAEKYYVDSQPTNDFDNLKVAKFYNELGKFDKAEEYLLKIKKRDPFYYQNRAKQLKGSDDTEGALEAINSAIEGLNRGECGYWFLSSFLNDKAEILYKINIENAIEVLTDAIDKQNNIKTKKAWERKSLKWQASY